MLPSKNFIIDTPDLCILQLYYSSLQKFSYYIESDGKSMVLSPTIDVDFFFELANERKAQLISSYETHIPFNYVTGSYELFRKTKCSVFYHSNMKDEMNCAVFSNLEDNYEMKLGCVCLKVLATPGHTSDSSCLFLSNEKTSQSFLFSGNTLLLKDVGRPVSDGKNNTEGLSVNMFTSIFSRLLSLPDQTIILPGSHAGVIFGKTICEGRSSTILEEKTNNNLLKQAKEEFIDSMMSSTFSLPPFCQKILEINKIGSFSFDQKLKETLVFLPVQPFLDAIKANDTLLVDTRKNLDFIHAHIPNAIFISMDAPGFENWFGFLFNDKKYAFICDKGREKEVAVRLIRTGNDRGVGMLEGGIEAWKEEVSPDLKAVETIEGVDLQKNLTKNDILIDVRKKNEIEQGMIEGSQWIELINLEKEHTKLNKNKKIFLMCASGIRSLIGISILQKLGFEKLVNVMGGFPKAKESGINIIKPPHLSGY